MRINYFNTLPLRVQLEELGKCRFMDRSEFANGVDYIRGKKIVIIGCGAQGLNQGLCLKDSGLDVSYALRPEAIAEKRQSYKKKTTRSRAKKFFQLEICIKFVYFLTLKLSTTTTRANNNRDRRRFFLFSLTN